MSIHSHMPTKSNSGGSKTQDVSMGFQRDPIRRSAPEGFLVRGVAGVIGLLASGLATGFVLAIMMANAGGSWDNAKKYIEAGDLEERLVAPQDLVEAGRAHDRAQVNDDGILVVVDRGTDDDELIARIIAAARAPREHGKEPGMVPVVVMRGKGSSNHKAAVVGDTVGDPFKDTSGPSLNILIKLCPGGGRSCELRAASFEPGGEEPPRTRRSARGRASSREHRAGSSEHPESSIQHPLPSACIRVHLRFHRPGCWILDADLKPQAASCKPQAAFVPIRVDSWLAVLSASLATLATLAVHPFPSSLFSVSSVSPW